MVSHINFPPEWKFPHILKFIQWEISLRLRTPDTHVVNVEDD